MEVKFLIIVIYFVIFINLHNAIKKKVFLKKSFKSYSQAIISMKISKNNSSKELKNRLDSVALEGIFLIKDISLFLFPYLVFSCLLFLINISYTKSFLIPLSLFIPSFFSKE